VRNDKKLLRLGEMVDGDMLERVTVLGMAFVEELDHAQKAPMMVI